LIKFKFIDNQKNIWCRVRKKYVVSQPEEKVRQEFIEYLHKEKSYPLSLMKVEKLVQYPNMLKRSDIIVYDRNGTAKMLIECKSPNVKISQSVFQQISEYNKTLHAPYLTVTNGKTHYCSKINFSSGDIKFLKDIPNFKEL